MSATNGEPDDTAPGHEAADAAAHPAEGDPGHPPAARSTAAVQLKVPPFYRQNTKVWFLQLESQFALSRVTSEQTKFHHCLASLPEDVAALLDLTGDPNYAELKRALLSIFGRSKSQTLDEALHTLDVASLKPSVAAQKLRKNFADAGLGSNDDLVKHRILRAATPSMQTVLAAHQHLPLSDFLGIADAVFDVGQATPQSVTQVADRYPSRRRSPSPHPSRGIALGLQPFKPDQRQVVCRSHIFYGVQAKTCKPWCQWPGPKPTSRTASPARQSGNV